MRYRGILEIDATRRGGGLPVELAISGRSLTVTSDTETLGTYPIDEVEVARAGSDRFDLRVGAEQLVFVADDAIRFSYEAIPFIESAHGDLVLRAVDKVKAWWTAMKPAPVPTDTPPVEDPAVFEPAAVTPAGRAFSVDRRPSSLPGLRERLRSIEDLDAFVPDREPSPIPPVGGSMSAEAPSVGPVEQTPPLATCMGVRSDGKVCGSAVISARGFCFAHDPDRVAQRREIQEHTARAAERVRRTVGENLGDVVARLERAVAEVHEGRLDPQQALAMASLAHAMVETIELAKSQEPGDSPV